MAKVDICVINYGTKSMTLDAVKSFLAYTSDAHIYVVDNASPDQSWEYLQANLKNIERVTLIKSDTNLGYGRGCNLAASKGNSKYVVFSNSDIAVTKGWWEPLEKVLEMSKVGVVAPKLLNRQGRIVGAGVVGSLKNRLIRGFGGPGNQYTHTEEVISLCGALFAMPRNLFNEIGGYNPAYDHYFEETELMLEIKLRGYRVMYCGESVVYHWLHGSEKDAKKLRHLFEKSKEIFDKKYKDILK